METKDIIYELRTKKGFSQEELAKMIEQKKKEIADLKKKVKTA